MSGSEEQPGANAAAADSDGLAVLRDRIEAVDRHILELMAERVDLAREIGKLKRDADAPTLDPGREASVIRGAVEAGREMGLPEEPVRQLFWTLVGVCRGAQLDR